MSEPLVWLPFPVTELGEVPAGLRYETVDPADGVPADVDEVEFFVPAYQMRPEVVETFPRMTSLRVVQSLSAGIDSLRRHIPDGVQLCNGRGIHDTSTAELAVTLVLTALRGIPRFVRQQTQQVWKGGFEESLADKQVLIVGYGSIGQAIEARLDGFECAVVRVARHARDGVHAFTDLPALLPEADVVVLVVPLTDETRGMVDEDFLGRLKPGALLVNVARGAVVDTAAVLAALAAGRIRYATDVAETEPLPADHPLWSAPGALVTPHVGGASSAMRVRAHRLLRAQLERFAAGQPLHNVITGAY